MIAWLCSMGMHSASQELKNLTGFNGLTHNCGFTSWCLSAPDSQLFLAVRILLTMFHIEAGFSRSLSHNPSYQALSEPPVAETTVVQTNWCPMRNYWPLRLRIDRFFKCLLFSKSFHSFSKNDYQNGPANQWPKSLPWNDLFYRSPVRMRFCLFMLLVGCMWGVAPGTTIRG